MKIKYKIYKKRLIILEKNKVISYLFEKNEFVLLIIF